MNVVGKKNDVDGSSEIVNDKLDIIESNTTNNKYGNNGYETHEQKIYPHLEIFKAKNWGLIIYDEVHLLPAPVFRTTADIQAKRRLGLTATSIREDSMENDVFSFDRSKKV